MKKPIHIEKCNRAFLSTNGDRESYIILSSLSVLESTEIPFYFKTNINIKLRPAISDDSEFILLYYYGNAYSLTTLNNITDKLKNAVTDCMSLISLINSVIQNKKEYIEKDVCASVELKAGNTIKLKPVKRGDGSLVFEIHDDNGHCIVVRSDSLAKLKGELNRFSKALSAAIVSLTIKTKFNSRGIKS